MKLPELGLAFRTLAQVRELVPAGGRSSKSRFRRAQNARVSACRWQDFVTTHRTHMDDVLQHLDAALHGHGTAQLHVPGICTLPRAGGCQLVHRPQLTICVCPSLLFWWAGVPLAWSPLRLQRVLEQLVRQMLSWVSRLSIIRSAGVSPSKGICAIHSSRTARAGVGALDEADAAYDTTSVDVAC